jgi:hypothetical protein
LNKKIDPVNDLFKTATSFNTLDINNHDLNFKPSHATDNFDLNNYLAKLNKTGTEKGGKCNIVYDDGSE